MYEIPNFHNPMMYNDAVFNVDEAVGNRLEGIRVWAAEMEQMSYRSGDLIRWAAGRFDSAKTAAIDAHMDGIKSQEESMIAAVEAVRDNADSEEEKIAAIGAIVRPGS